MAKRVNSEINGKSYFRIRKKDGMKYDEEKGIWVDNILNFYGLNKTEAESKVKYYFDKKDLGGQDCLGILMENYIYEVFIFSSKWVEGTKELYERAYRKNIVNSDLARKPICDVGPMDIQKFYKKLLDEGAKKSNLKNTHKVLLTFCKYARTTINAPNFMDLVEIPQNSDIDQPDDEIEEITVFEKEELEAIFKNKELAGRLRFLYILASSSGARQGELLAAEYSDIQNSKFKISKQYKQTTKISSDKSRTTLGKIAKTKGKKTRIVPLPESVIAELEIHKEWHKNEMMRNGYRTNYIFTTEEGSLLDKSNVRKRYKKFLKEIGIPHKKFHAFRSTYCTNLYEHGAPIELTAKLLGHSNLETTKNFYLQIGERQVEDTANLLASMYDEWLTKWLNNG